MGLFNVVGVIRRTGLYTARFSVKAGKGAMTLCIDYSYKKFVVTDAKASLINLAGTGVAPFSGPAARAVADAPSGHSRP
jgi:hypothetical protein